tara:strand:+ start:4713 stop:5486 length:774 start_codon:yes stop_codon:yes gene_type:complete
LPHISFSEIKNWAECPWRHKLLYVDKLDVRSGNEYSAFGTAVHDTVEKMLQGTDQDPYEYFHLKFNEQLAKSATDTGSKLAEDMRVQINGVFESIIPALDKYFHEKGGWTLVDTEFELMQPISETDIKDYNFKGFVDLIVKDGEGHYHVIDWKTCTWGWNARKKSNTLLTRQLVYYKYYYAKSLGIDPRCVSTHFGLIKRTAKKDRVEIFRVTSGERKTKNSLDFLDQALYNIQNRTSIKNRLSCLYCPFKDTEHCT